MSAGGPKREMFSPQEPGAGEPRSTLPWVIAGGVVLTILGLIVALSHHGPPANPGGAGLAPAAAYAAYLPISNLQMSQAGTMSGAQAFYMDGRITNTGSETVTGITVQVAFPGFTEAIAQKNTMPLMLIRTREPEVDLEPVGAMPILPRQTREFRLIFDTIPQDWNQNYPTIRIIQVTGK